MELNKDALKNKAQWEKIGVKMPAFDFDSVCANTKENPVWIHFGVGNIFRGYIARLQNDLLNCGAAQRGIIAAETFDAEIIDRICVPHDGLTLLVTLKADGSTEKEAVASISESLHLGHRKRMESIFRNSHLQMVSFTVTEKGYALTNMQGEYMPAAQHDIDNAPDDAAHLIGIITALMLERYKAGAFPLALVSMDNCSQNGDRLKSSVLTIAAQWVGKGHADKGFVDYLSDVSKVSFPWSMIDKITPWPDNAIKESLSSAGIENMQPIITSKNTFIAPFVNAEVSEYLVIEDSFPNGRPALEKAGVYFTSRETVDKVECMKVTTCLNPLHTTLAIFGCLLGYTSISDAMGDADLNSLVKRIGYIEALPTVVNPGIINPETFLREVIEERFPNPLIPDTPQRIATDTSQKIAIRFGETIKTYINRPDLDINTLKGIPLTIAAWFRYLLTVDDSLKPFELSTDPMLPQLLPLLNGINAKDAASYSGQLRPILSNKALFGVDLNECGLSDKIETMFVRMLDGEGAVRSCCA